MLKVAPLQQRFTDRFDAATIERLRGEQLDVVLRFGFRIIRGDILEIARYGVWSFHHGDNRQYRGSPPMFWEMYEGNPTCGVTLQILTEELDGGKAIYRTAEKTNFYSLFVNSNRCYWKATGSVNQRLAQVHRHGWPALEELDSYRDETRYEKPVYRPPGNGAMLVFLLRLAGRLVRRAAVELLTEEHWSIAWRRLGEPLPAMPTTAGRAISPARSAPRVLLCRSLPH